MTKVNIHGCGHRVEIDYDGDLDTVSEAAWKLWDATLRSEPSPGPAAGFTVAERQDRTYFGAGRSWQHPAQAGGSQEGA